MHYLWVTLAYDSQKPAIIQLTATDSCPKGRPLLKGQAVVGSPHKTLIEK